MEPKFHYLFKKNPTTGPQQTIPQSYTIFCCVAPPLQAYLNHSVCPAFCVHAHKSKTTKLILMSFDI
jgi:hypothetical protein